MIRPHQFTVSDFALMSEAGLFRDQKAELLDGIVYDMSPASPEHEAFIDELHERFVQHFAHRARVRSQNALDVGDPYWLPHPDVLLLKRRSYHHERPKPDDVLLLVEVASSSLSIDRGKKLDIYARSGIRDYWIADLDKGEWIVHREPSAGQYRQVTRIPFETPLAPVAFPDDAHVWV